MVFAIVIIGYVLAALIGLGWVIAGKKKHPHILSESEREKQRNRIDEHQQRQLQIKNIQKELDTILKEFGINNN